MNSVFVTNRNDTPHSDMYDGEIYEFPPNEKVHVSVDAARHMFGYGNPDKSETLVRLGRAMKYHPDTKTFTEDTDGVKWLSRFVFDEAIMVSRSSLAPKPDNLEIA